MTIMGNFSTGSTGPNKSPMAFNMPISLRGHANNVSQHVKPSPPSPTNAKVSFARQLSILMHRGSQILIYRISGTELTWQGAPYISVLSRAESRRIGKGPSLNSILWYCALQEACVRSNMAIKGFVEVPQLVPSPRSHRAQTHMPYRSAHRHARQDASLSHMDSEKTRHECQ